MIQVLIDGVDRTAKVEIDSIVIDSVMTNRRDTATFGIGNHSGESYVPNMGQEVIIMDGATKIFGGIITNIDSEAGSYLISRHTIKCQDYTRLLDHRLIPDAFTDKTVDFIIDYLRDNYFPAGFTINNVDAPVTVRYINFKYRPLAQCIQDLANMFNYDWYVDYDKDVHFFAKQTELAPFEINDDDGSYIYGSLILRKDNSQMRNSIIVRGGDYLAASFTSEFEANGVDFTFPLPYRYDDFRATLTGDPLSIGRDGIDQPNDFDALYNFQEKVLKFKQSDTPSVGSVLVVSGQPYLPVIVRYRSPSAIASTISAEGGDGIYEYLIEDKSINSKEGAIQRARAEILAYAETLVEGEFITYTAGLSPGQSIVINSPSRGINETYTINRVKTVQFGVDTFKYQVSMLTTRTMDLVDVLQKLLLESTKKIDIDPFETTNVVLDFSDEAAFEDSHLITTSQGPYIWGSFTWGFGAWA